MANDDYVVFEDSQGNEISNDPRWKAAKTLEAAGVEVGKSDSLTDAERAELEELREFKRTQGVAQAPNEFNGTADVEEQEEDDDDDEENPYAEVKGAALATLAKERGIKLTAEDGTKLKAGQVRAALADQDLGAAGNQ
jgi:hypothetical protein